MFDIGFFEIGFFALLLLLLLGPKELVSVMRQLGQWTRQAKYITQNFTQEIYRLGENESHKNGKNDKGDRKARVAKNEYNKDDKNDKDGKGGENYKRQ